MKEFRELLALALVGTARGQLPAHDGSPLAPALDGVQDDPEGTLLGRAALAGLVRYAGRTAEPLRHDPPSLAPPETRPEAPERVARHLNGILGTPLLPEWLALCAGAGWRVPPQVLPTLLDLARHNTELREQLRPVLGERGGWLAQFNPEWRWGSSFSEEAWEAATEAQKEALFHDLRQKHPDVARALLTQHFKTEKAGVRKRLLSVLHETWKEADATLEALLEEALQDRSPEVQDQARLVLQNLPTSAYNQRMTARLLTMLQQEKVGLIGKLMGQRKFTLHPPATLDADAGRDGLTPLSAHEKNATLEHFRELVASTHPQALADALQRTPDDLLTLLGQLDAADQLRQATLTTGHEPSARALQRHFSDDVALMRLSPPQNIHQRIHALLKGTPDVSPLLTLLNLLPPPWPADLGEQLLNAIHDYASGNRTSQRHDYRWEHLMQEVARHAPPHVRRPPALPPPEDNSYYASRLWQQYTDMLGTLEQRERMYRDFAEAQA